jgi:tight adherence protein C
MARSVTPQAYLAMKAGTAGGAILLGLMISITGGGTFGLVIALVGAAIGFIAPEFVINSRVRGRKDEMKTDLPNVLDLLSVCVEAGLGFDQALVKLNERMEGPLVDEFALVLHEMRIGQSRSAALKNLAERVDSPDVGQFARAIIQADQLGISLSRILKVQSQDMRVRRQLAAEEKAMKAPVKMLFPTVIFIFPSMFVVALGPAMLNLMKTFSGG